MGFDQFGRPMGSMNHIAFGDVITNKSRVEERIRRARRAILNPSTSRKTFLEGRDRDPDEMELDSSENCVCLELSGPDLTDLSFCDPLGTWLVSVPRGPFS